MCLVGWLGINFGFEGILINCMQTFLELNKEVLRGRKEK